MNNWNEQDHPREQASGQFTDKHANETGDTDLDQSDPFHVLFNQPYADDSLTVMGERQQQVLDDAVRTQGTIDQRMLEERKQYIEQVLPTLPDTQSQYSIQTASGIREYSTERLNQQERIINRLLEQAENVPCERKALFTGGLGGAGKTTILKRMGLDPTRFLTLNNDDIKEEMARDDMIPKVKGLTPMEACPLVHEEASDILSRLRAKALSRGMNVILDGTMSSPGSVQRKTRQLHDNGYDVACVFVDIRPETSKQRALKRYQRGMDRYTVSGGTEGMGGRFLPDHVIDDQQSTDTRYRSRNAQTLVTLAEDHTFDHMPIVYDNDRDGMGMERHIPYREFRGY